MFLKTISRILHIAYPFIIFAVVLAAWSSLSLSELAYVSPPTGDGLNMSWKPSVMIRSTCRQSTHARC